MDLIRAGSCFLLLEDSNVPHHLWIVLTDPIGKAAEVLTVMLVTHKAHSDDTVILVVGDHPFITRNTSVNYSTAQFRLVRLIIAEMHRHRCHLREDLAADQLKRVQQGLIDSPRTVNHVRDRFQSWLDDR